MNGDLFLGIDWLRANKIVLSLKSKILTKHFGNKQSVEFHLNDSGNVGQTLYANIKCFALENVDIARGTTSKVPIYFSVPLVEPCQMLLYSNDLIEPKLCDKARGLNGVADTPLKSILCIASDRTANIKEGQIVGNVSSVVELPAVSDDNVKIINDLELVDHVKLPELKEGERRKVYDVLERVKGVFSVSEFDLGHANVTEHVIKLTDNTPIYQRPRRFPPPMADEIERQCRELHSLDIIEPSISPWNSPIVPIMKKGGGMRMCLDYRKLNKATVPDRHPMPNLIDSLFGFHGTKFFTRLDLVKSYYQIPIDKESRKCTAFSTPKNHWQFKRLSFGLRNAPSAFQREIQAVLSEFPSCKVICYIDDILICLLYTSPSPRDKRQSRMPSSA